MQHSGENSANAALKGSNSYKNKALKHYQSTSDAGASSLISVGYENSKYTKLSAKIDQSPKISSEKAMKMMKGKNVNLSQKKKLESDKDPLLQCIEEIGNTQSKDILDKFQLNWIEQNNSDEGDLNLMKDFKNQTKKQFMKT